MHRQLTTLLVVPLLAAIAIGCGDTSNNGQTSTGPSGGKTTKRSPAGDTSYNGQTSTSDHPPPKEKPSVLESPYKWEKSSAPDGEAADGITVREWIKDGTRMVAYGTAEGGEGMIPFVGSSVIVDTPGARDVHIEIDPEAKSTTYAGLTFTEPCVVEIRADGTIHPNIVGVLAKDRDGNLWESRKMTAAADSEIAFYPKQAAVSRTRGSHITSSRMWECPKCGTILAKGNLGKVWNPGDPIETVGGTATCGGCETIYQQADVYGGKYDVGEKANKQDKPNDVEGKVALVTFRNFSTTPPKNQTEISIAILKNRYPKAALGKNYLIGLTDSITTADEAVAQYKANVKENKLPDLGSQFDVWTGKDITGTQVTTLFFK